MKKNIYFLLCSILLIIGSLFFFYQESWIVFLIPRNQTYANINHQSKNSSKIVTLWAWDTNTRTEKKESTEIIYGDDTPQNIKLLLNNWFLFAEEEKLTDKQIIVQSVALSPSATEAFISINQYPFDKSTSTYTKLMLIESLLKTIRENKIPITSIRLLVHHQPIVDDHLNFDIPWPIQGYLS